MLFKMKVILFCICISYSLSADNFKKPSLPRHSSRKGSPNEPNRTNRPPDRQYQPTLENEDNPTDSSESARSRQDNTYYPGTHRYDENLCIETPNYECRDGAGGTDRPDKTWSCVGPNSSSGQHSHSISSTGGFSAEGGSYHNVASGSSVEPNVNIPSSMGNSSVRPKNRERWINSRAPSSDVAGTNLPSFSGAFGNYCQSISIGQPSNPFSPVRSELDNQESAIADHPSVIPTVTPMDLNLERSFNSADPNLLLASGSLYDEEATGSTSEQNYVTRVEIPQTARSQTELDLPMFQYISSLYTLKALLIEVLKHFGSMELVGESVTLENSRETVDLLMKIQDNLYVMASLTADEECDRFGIDSQRLNIVLSTISELTPYIDIYLVGIHNNREEAMSRIPYLMHITKKLHDQLNDFLESTRPELYCLQDKSHLDVCK